MSSEPNRGVKSFWLSVAIGAYTGVTLQFLLASWYEPIDFSELWAIPLILIIYGLFAVPFVALGLAIFGLPLTHLLYRSARKSWVGAIAILWSAVAGKLLFFAVDHLMFFGQYEIAKIQLLDMGIIYGLPTGVAWWLLRRRELIAI